MPDTNPVLGIEVEGMDDLNSSSLLMSEGVLFLFERTEVTAFETASAIFSTARLELVSSPSIEWSREESQALASQLYRSGV